MAMDWNTAGLAAYLAVGVLVDIFVHLTHPIMYWDRGHALKSHAMLILTWPYVIFALFRR